MRDSSIEGSYDCGEWYRKDPKYTEAFLLKNALATGANGQPTKEACACEGCSGTKAIDFCPQDKADPNSDYMDIDTAKANGVIEKMRLAINDDMLDPEKCRKNGFCRNHTCLEVRAFFRSCVAGKEHLELDFIWILFYLQFSLPVHQPHTHRSQAHTN